jgi:hypothetical protein
VIAQNQAVVARRRRWAAAALAAAAMCCGSCAHQTRTGEDPKVTSLGSIEVTARLVEVPEGAIFKRDMYDYATILKYEIVKVHRGELKGGVIFVGHYNPWKPRAQAADKIVQGIGGDLGAFEAGQVHRMALQAPIDDYYMGGIINKYFGHTGEPIYWAVWTNLAE